MKVLGIRWVGARTNKFNELSRLFGKTLGMKKIKEEKDFNVFKTKDGGRVEVFGPKCKYNKHFAKGPVVGFLVADIEKAALELKGDKVKLIGGIKEGSHGYKWLQFRAPDGNIYEIEEDPKAQSQT